MRKVDVKNTLASLLREFIDLLAAPQRRRKFPEMKPFMPWPENRT